MYEPWRRFSKFAAGSLFASDKTRRTNSANLLHVATKRTRRFASCVAYVVACMTWGAENTLLRRADIIPAHLFGPGHASLKYGLEIDGAIAPSKSYQAHVITNEINR